MQKSIFLLLSFFSILNLYAQSDSTIVVHKDPRIDILNAKREVVRSVVKKPVTSTQRGYRVQVINTRSRDEALLVKANLLKDYAVHKTYLIFQSPYFKVRIGNFITREEANKFKAALASKPYGQTAYLVEDMVEYTTIVTEKIPVK